VGKLDLMVRGSSDQHGIARERRGRGIEQALEELPVALDLDRVPAPLDEEPIEGIDFAFDDDIRPQRASVRMTGLSSSP